MELMGEVGFSKVTVDSLAKKASINRNTFYLHYADKFDLLAQLQDEILEGLKGILKDMPIELVKEKGLYNDQSIAVIHRVYHYIKENSCFFMLMMQKDGDPAFLMKFGNTIKGIMMSKISQDETKAPQRYIFAMMISVFTGIVGEWLNSGMRESPEEVANMLILYLGDVPRKLLNSLGK